MTHLTTRQFKKYFTLSGVLLLIFGVIQFSAYKNSHNSELLYDAIINSVNGVIFLLSAYLIVRKSAYALIAFVVSLITSVLYGIFMERGINYLLIFIDGLFILELLFLLKKGIIDFDGFEEIDENKGD